MYKARKLSLVFDENAALLNLFFIFLVNFEYLGGRSVRLSRLIRFYLITVYERKC